MTTAHNDYLFPLNDRSHTWRNAAKAIYDNERQFYAMLVQRWKERDQMSWGLEINATSVASAKDQIEQLQKRNSLPEPIGNQIMMMIDQLPPASVGANRLINVKTHGHFGAGYTSPNVHIDVRTYSLDKVE